MKIKTKSHKKSGGKKSRRGKRGRRSLSGLGVVKQIGVQIAKDTLNPLAILLGYGIGAAGGRLLDKVSAITPDPTAEGFQWKSIIKPVSLVLVGVGVSAVTHHFGAKGGKQPSMGVIFLKNVGHGITVAGGVSLVKGVIKKDIFDGLGAAGSMDAKYLEESKALLQQLVEQAGNEASLPELNEGNSSSDDMGSTVIPIFSAEEQGTIL